MSNHETLKYVQMKLSAFSIRKWIGDREGMYDSSTYFGSFFLTLLNQNRDERTVLRPLQTSAWSNLQLYHCTSALDIFTVLRHKMQY